MRHRVLELHLERWEDLPDLTGSGSRLSDAQEDQIREALASLDDEQGAIVRMVVWEGKTYAEAGAEFGRSRSYARRRYKEAVKQLGALLEDV